MINLVDLDSIYSVADYEKDVSKLLKDKGELAIEV